MLKINLHQIEALQKNQKQRFINELSARLEENFTATIHCYKLDNARLTQIIERGIERAEHYQIVNEYDVVRFIEYIFEFTGEFEQLSWAMPILNASGLSGSEKMDKIDAIATFDRTG